MKIGVPKEIKAAEYRVGLTPESARELVVDGHTVLVESGAGLGIGATDALYRDAGATMVGDAAAVFAQAELIVKVKEPQPAECHNLREHHTLFTYLHLAADVQQARLLCESGSTCVAYETVTSDTGGLPLLAPMSEVAGRMSVQVAAWCQEKKNGGAGKLLGGVPGVPAAHVVVLGAGVSGLSAVAMAVGLGAQVTVFDRALERLRVVDSLYRGRVNTRYSTVSALEDEVAHADVVIGAVLVPGAAAPKLVTKNMVSTMRAGSVLVDISIDQGGCFETSRPTSHFEPTYVVDGVVHYCVTNMPGAVPRTSAYALNIATLPFVRELARSGAAAALKANKHLRAGLNVHAGHIVHPAVAGAMGLSLGRVPF